jgi:hypothetical protein
MKKIRVVYTGQGFEQDAGQAMGSDVVRGLIELVTNADDAYGKAVGEIRIEVHRPKSADDATVIAVRDNAIGLSTEAMERNFSTLGGDLSGFAAGESKRGLFGRGSKDTAWFGKTVFESIHEGIYTELVLNRDGSGTVDHRASTPSDHSRLNIKSGTNGLSASMHVYPQYATVADGARLVQRLSTHVQLRALLQRQSVLLVENRSGRKTTHPIKWDPPLSDTIFEDTIPIPDYGVSCKLTLRKLRQRIEGPVNEYSITGIAIRGSRTTYMNTFFELSGYGTGLLCGELECTAIDDLIRQYDKSAKGSGKDKVDLKNPFRIIRRDRDGLARNHPFAQALARLVVERVRPILDSLEPEQREGGSKQLKKDLSQIASLLGSLIREDLGEDEDDVGGIGKPTREKPITVIPPTLRGRVGTSRTLTVLIHAETIGGGSLSASTTDSAVNILGAPSQPVPHKTFVGTVVSQLRLELRELGTTDVMIWLTDQRESRASATVLVHDDARPDEIPPAGLEWKNFSMSVTVGKERNLTLRAPAELAPTGSMGVTVEMTGETVELLQEACVLELTTRGWLEGKIRVRGVKLGKPCTVTARAKGQIETGRITTTLPSPVSGFNFDIRLVDRAEGSTRGVVTTEESGRVLLLFARHPALADHLGRLRTDGTYANERQAAARAVLAEAISAVVSDFVLRIDVDREPSLYSDVDMILQRRNSLFHRYIQLLVKVLRAEPEV